MWKRIAALLVLSLSLPALAAVKRFELTTHSSVFPVDQGVYVKGFSFNEMSPGPLLVVEEGDTVGGIFEVVALGVPPGLGSHVHFDRRLSGRLLGALASIPAVKGVEVGPAFTNARRRGTQVHDPILRDPEGHLRRASNRAGGLEGGITTGEPIVLRAAMKPISTTRAPLPSVDLATGKTAAPRYERSDVCAVPRAAVIGEAMVAWVLADELLRKLGGDSLGEQLPRFAALRRSHLADLPMDNVSWRFEYPGMDAEL